MARTRKSSLASKASRRRSVWRLLVAMLLALALTASPASSFSLPIETPTVPVETPTVPVKTPTVPVKTPTVPVKTPTVPVKTPTVPVKTPTVPVKTPTVPVKVPTVPVKVPTVPVKVPTVPVKVPTVPVKVPTVPVKTPTVKVPSTPVKTPTTPGKAPGTPVKTTTAKAPGVSVSTPSIAGRGAEVGVSSSGVSVKGSASGKALTSGSARGGASASASSGPAGAGQGTAPSGTAGTGSSGGYAGPGAGYGELPSFEGVRDGTARARIARRERRLKATVARFGGCLSALPDTQRRVLELRTGFGPTKALSRRAAAARLHIAGARLVALEKQALGELSSAASSHDCGRTSQIVAGAMSLIAAGLGGGDGAGAARGGVEGVRYEKAPSSGAGAAKASVSSKPLFGVGLPGVDLLLLLLIPLFLIGLTILELVVTGTRRGPLMRLLGRGAVHTPRRRSIPRQRR
jgi:hypothetical protein